MTKMSKARRDMYEWLTDISIGPLEEYLDVARSEGDDRGVRLYEKAISRLRDMLLKRRIAQAENYSTELTRSYQSTGLEDVARGTGRRMAKNKTTYKPSGRNYNDLGI